VQNLENACKLISATAARLQESNVTQKLPVGIRPLSTIKPFPTLNETERAMIMAAYRRSNGKRLEAARLLGIGKTTLHRMLKEIRRGLPDDHSSTVSKIASHRNAGLTVGCDNSI